MMSPIRSLYQNLRLGISRGTYNAGRSIYMHTATLSMDVPVIDSSTLLSSSQSRLWSHRKA